MTPPIRLAYVLRAFPRLSETFILGEIQALLEAGADVRIYALERVTEPVRHPAAEALMSRVTWLPAALRGEALHVPARRDALPEAAGRWLAALLVRDGVDHVHAPFAGPAAAVAAVASRRAGVPFTFTAHAKDIFSRRVSWPRVRRIARAAACVVTVSDYNRRFLRRRLGPATPVVRLYNGVDLDAWRPARRPGRAARILAVGRLVHKKGFHVLVEAMARLAAWGVPGHATVIGDGVEREALVALARARGVTRRIRFAGARPAEDVRRAMRHATLVTLPCVVAADGNQDALPTVLIEAAACGLPVVSTRVAGVPEIVEHRTTGYVVAPGDAVALARAMRRLLERPDLGRRMGRRARARTEQRFDRRRAAHALLSIVCGATRRTVEGVADARHAAVS